MEESFADFMEAATEVYSDLANPPAVERTLVQSFVSTLYRFRLLAIAEDGPIRRNKLATPQELERLRFWYESIESYLFNALLGNRAHVCLYRIMHYIMVCGTEKPHLYKFLIPYAEQAAEDVEFGVVEDAEAVLRKLRQIE